MGLDDSRQAVKGASPTPKKEQALTQDKTPEVAKPINPLEPNQNNNSPEAPSDLEKPGKQENPKVKDQPNKQEPKTGKDGAPDLTETPGDNQAKANKIISTRLTKSDIERLRALVKDGLTAAEEKEALAILRARLPEKEFAFLYNKIYLPYVKKRVSK